MDVRWLRYLALQAVLWWSLGRSQEPGFLSLDCGSTDTTAYYTDEYKLRWVNDADYISEGTATQINVDYGVYDYEKEMTTMRVFDGNHSKYCYHLTNNSIIIIKEGSFYLVRASFSVGVDPPYIPQSPGKLRFKLIVDADIWGDMEVSYGNEVLEQFVEIYVRAQRDSIDVCFARSKPGGDFPFVSALEVRNLPPTLTSTTKMQKDNLFFVLQKRINMGDSDSDDYLIPRYPDDRLDRIWESGPASDQYRTNTSDAIDVSTNQDVPPIPILQDAFSNISITLPFRDLDPTVQYFAEFYFAEINPNVSKVGQRAFNILLNGGLQNVEGPIDVFAAVGPDAAYSYAIAGEPNADGLMLFNITTIATSIYPPFLAGYEFFSIGMMTALTDANTVSAVEDIKASLNLTSYTGDPCLPIGFGYEWLNCSQKLNVTSISLSNYSTGGKIPVALNGLTLLSEIHLDGNRLQGEIPDLSALTNLQVLLLSNNELTGSIPEYLATLTKLKVLDVRNNKLSGEVPATLLERKQALTLTFEFSNNPLCDTGSGNTCTPSPNTSAPSEKRNNSGSIIIGVAVAGVLLVGFGIALVVYCMCKRRSSSTLEQPIRMQELSEVDYGPKQALCNYTPKLSVQEYSFQEIKVATNNFSTLLGKGGFGPVYKGRFQDSCFVAIKVASDFSHQGSKEFLNEVDLLSRVHYKNLVALLGYCTEEKLVLVYDFMSNGSLFDCLHGPHARASPLSWSMRLKILVDAAQGLDYLHDGCYPRIIHRDVKSSNILLNDQLEAKISDFGVSRNSFVDESRGPATALMGSMGYMDPEYASLGILTEKVNIYSFGVVLFEVVCGKTAVFTDSSQQQVCIVDWASSLIDCGAVGDIVDPLLHQQYNISSIWKVLDIALACVSSSRPKMSAVVQELKEAKQMELNCDRRNVFDEPPVEISGGSEFNSLSFTHVNAR